MVHGAVLMIDGHGAVLMIDVHGAVLMIDGCCAND